MRDKWLQRRAPFSPGHFAKRISCVQQGGVRKPLLSGIRICSKQRLERESARQTLSSATSPSASGGDVVRRATASIAAQFPGSPRLLSSCRGRAIEAIEHPKDPVDVPTETLHRAKRKVNEPTPALHLRTCFVLDEEGRIRCTREPEPTAGPIFTLIRSPSCCIWAVRADVPAEFAVELGRFAAREPLLHDSEGSPVYANAYLSLLGGPIASGPVFSFPDELTRPVGVTLVDDLHLLERHFHRWTASEISERSPIFAVRRRLSCQCLLLSQELRDRRRGWCRNRSSFSGAWTCCARHHGLGSSRTSVGTCSSLQHLLEQRGIPSCGA